MLDPDRDINLLYPARLGIIPYLLPVALVIPLDWRLPERPRALETSVFLVAVGIRSVIVFNGLEVRFRAILLKCRDPLLTFELDEILQVRSAFLAFLQLARDVHRFGLFVPQLEITLIIVTGVVKSAYKHLRLHLSFV